VTLPPDRPGRVDWPKVDRGLCETYGLTPLGVDALTLPEIAVLCMRADAKGPPTGVWNMSEQEATAWLARQAALTPAERLHEVRASRDG